MSMGFSMNRPAIVPYLHLRTPLRDVSRRVSRYGIIPYCRLGTEVKDASTLIATIHWQLKVGVELQLDLGDFNKIRALHGDLTIQTEDFIGFTWNRWWFDHQTWCYDGIEISRESRRSIATSRCDVTRMMVIGLGLLLQKWPNFWSWIILIMHYPEKCRVFFCTKIWGTLGKFPTNEVIQHVLTNKVGN